MKRPTKKDIKALVETLKAKPSTENPDVDINTGKLAPQHTSQRIRKKGI
jgi:hypothetical protein